MKSNDFPKPRPPSCSQKQFLIIIAKHHSNMRETNSVTLKHNQKDQAESVEVHCNYSDDEFEEADSEVKSEAKSETESEAKSEVQSEAKSEAKSEVQSEAKLEVHSTFEVPVRSMLRHRSSKSYRTRTAAKRNSEIQSQTQQAESFGLEEDEKKLSPLQTKTQKGIIKSWIPIPRHISGTRPTVSSISLDLETKTASASLVRKRVSSQPRLTKKTSSIQQRLNSAKDIQLKDVTSQINLLESTIHNLTAENRTLKTGFQRQEAALRKYEGVESDFPQVLTFHQNEVKYLQQALRKAQSISRKYEATVRKLNMKMISLEDNNAKLLKLVELNELDERERLQHRLIELNHQFELANEKLAETHRKFELLKKSHSRQVGVIHGKYRESHRRVYDAEQELYRLTELVEQKDRVISYLRMRSREPGLEPPHHRKVMGEYESSYKYTYLIQQSYEPNKECNTFQHQSKALPKITVHYSENEEEEEDSNSRKSNDSTFSEELARRSRERNLDFPVLDYVNEVDDNENIEEVRDENDQGIFDMKSIIGMRVEFDIEEHEDGISDISDQNLPEDEDNAFDDEYRETAPCYEASDELKEAMHTPRPQPQLDDIIQSQLHVPKEASTNNTTVIDTQKNPDRACSDGEAPPEWSSYNNREVLDKRGDEVMSNGGGDADCILFMRKEEKTNGDSKYFTSRNQQDFDKQNQHTPRDEYSEEEFYCENADEEDKCLDFQMDPDSIEVKRSKSTTQVNKSGTLGQDSQFFTFTSKPTYIGESETENTSEDNPSASMSKHDFIFKASNSSLPSRHLSAGTSESSLKVLPGAISLKGKSETLTSFDSHNARMSLQKIPKCPSLHIPKMNPDDELKEDNSSEETFQAQRFEKLQRQHISNISHQNPVSGNEPAVKRRSIYEKMKQQSFTKKLTR